MIKRKEKKKPRYIKYIKDKVKQEEDYTKMKEEEAKAYRELQEQLKYEDENPE